jgi:polynucleotide 5'-hydroxyl-kinase GRC3/NOL9
MEIIGPDEWYALLDALEKEKGIAVLLGATDTGKSTLAKFLIFNLCKRGLKVALVDADIGQSFLGPPTTIGFSIFKSDPTWELILSPPEIFFVGSTTPEGCFPIHGFILGEGGKELKRRKIDLLSPRFILALQNSNEIESLLELYQETPHYKIIRLPLSDQVNPRTVEERRSNRTNKFQEYFKHSMTHELTIENIQIEGEVLDPNGDILPNDWALKINGLLIGLKDSNEETLALGLIKNYFEEKKILRVSTPLREMERVKTIQLSSLKVILHSEEERF